MLRLPPPSALAAAPHEALWKAPSIHMQPMSALPSLTSYAAAGLPPAPASRGGRVRHAKSNSERGKEFRARRKQFEAELIASVHSLRREIAELDRQRSLWSERPLRTHWSDAGSLARMVQEYYTLFKYGLADPDVLEVKRARMREHEGGRLQSIQVQEDFMRQLMADDIAVGDEFGPEASIQQWRRNTMAYDDNYTEVLSITAEGTDYEPMVTIRAKAYSRICKRSFEMVFPYALNRPDLMDKFLGQMVVYDVVHSCLFNTEGKITREIVNIDVVGGFLKAGFSLKDVAALMECNIMTPDSVLPDVNGPNSPLRSPSPSRDASTSPARTNSPKLTMDFLLSSSDEEDEAERSHRKVPPRRRFEEEQTERRRETHHIDPF